MSETLLDPLFGSIESIIKKFQEARDAALAMVEPLQAVQTQATQTEEALNQVTEAARNTTSEITGGKDQSNTNSLSAVNEILEQTKGRT